jgi:hypothetical protein
MMSAHALTSNNLLISLRGSLVDNEALRSALNASNATCDILEKCLSDASFHRLDNVNLFLLKGMLRSITNYDCHLIWFISLVLIEAEYQHQPNSDMLPAIKAMLLVYYNIKADCLPVTIGYLSATANQLTLPDLSYFTMQILARQYAELVIQKSGEFIRNYVLRHTGDTDSCNLRSIRTPELIDFLASVSRQQDGRLERAMALLDRHLDK